MNITFCCPGCDSSARVFVSPEDESLTCPLCEREIRFPSGSYSEGVVHRCLVCPSTDLYVRKDFPQRLGVLLVVIGIVGSSIAWYYKRVDLTFAVLFATALIDVVLYFLVGDALMCYRCHAQYRHLSELDDHGAFSLETHERYRQAAARELETGTNMSPGS